MSDGLVNGYPYWLKTNGSQAIWFSKGSSAWEVGSKSYLGKDKGLILGPGGNVYYPNEIKQRWRHYANVWQDAGPNDVTFKAIGTFFKPSLYKISPFPS